MRLCMLCACVVCLTTAIITNDLSATPLTVGADFSQRIPAHGNDRGPMDPVTITIADNRFESNVPFPSQGNVADF